MLCRLRRERSRIAREAVSDAFNQQVAPLPPPPPLLLLQLLLLIRH